MRFRRIALLMLLAPAGHLACGPGHDGEEVGRGRRELESSNELFQNSLSSNELFQNGLFQNELFQNELFQNELFQNGLIQNALWQDVFWQKNPAVRQKLRNNPYTRQVLKYVYECAMPPGTPIVLDPKTQADPAGANVALDGLIGLAPEWGQAGGACNESCQQWVTACVLARTNAYGVKVDISMRAPDDAPQHVKVALAVKGNEGEVGTERGDYTIFEGAFFGNLFKQSVRKVGDQELKIMTPHFYACSGTGSNVPELSRRFNANQGAGGPIEVVGPCLKQPLYPHSACEEVSSGAEAGAVKKCYPNTSLERQPDTLYREVITVYLKKPYALCNNSVCEEGEEGPAGTCPSDCPAGWAKSFGAVLTQGSASSTQDHRLTMASWARLSALAPDGSIVIAGVTPAAVKDGDVDLLPAVGSGSTDLGALLKFGADGTKTLGKRFDVGDRSSLVAVEVAPPGKDRITVVLNERQDTYGSSVRVISFDPANGNLVWSKSFRETAPTSSVSATALAVGPGGDIFVTATLVGGMGFGAMMLEAGVKPREFVLKLSPSGEPVWASRFDDEHSLLSLGARAIKVDSTGGSVVVLRHGGGGSLWKLTPDGTTKWQKKGIFGGAAFDPGGDVYATGALEQSPSGDGYDFQWPASAKIGDFFLARYDKESGQPSAPKTVGSFCSDPMIPCAYRWFTGREIAFTDAGDLLVGVRGGSRSTIDLGGGPFRSYQTDDLFVVALSKADLKPLWAKQLPVTLDGTLRGMHFAGAGEQRKVVVSGTFSGSTIVNGRALISPAPEQRSVGSTFLASFALPKSDDKKKPTIDEGSLPGPPAPGGAEATSADGARVFYVPPLSFDDGGAGVSVTCSPAPNSVFPSDPESPLKVTPVTCVASDPRGNKTSIEFDVPVIDRGPAFVTPPPPVVATSEVDGETQVFFDAPVAVDLVDGPLAATCIPPSGSSFERGTTMVMCEVADSKKTRTKVSFPVHVRLGGESCGNGALDLGEQCDDGNADDSDACSSTCAFPISGTNHPPDCSGASPSPAFLLASTGENWAPITIEGVTDPDDDRVEIVVGRVSQDESVDDDWCPDGPGLLCVDAKVEPLMVRAERDTWAENDPQPDGRVYFIEFTATDAQGAQCWGAVEVCVQRYYDVMFCGRGDTLYNSLAPP